MRDVTAIGDLCAMWQQLEIRKDICESNYPQFQDDANSDLQSTWQTRSSAI